MSFEFQIDLFSATVFSAESTDFWKFWNSWNLANKFIFKLFMIFFKTEFIIVFNWRCISAFMIRTDCDDFDVISIENVLICIRFKCSCFIFDKNSFFFKFFYELDLNFFRIFRFDKKFKWNWFDLLFLYFFLIEKSEESRKKKISKNSKKKFWLQKFRETWTEIVIRVNCSKFFSDVSKII